MTPERNPGPLELGAVDGAGYAGALPPGALAGGLAGAGDCDGFAGGSGFAGGGAG